MNRFLAREGTKSRVGVLGEVKASLLSTLEPLTRSWAQASLSSCLARLAKILTQGLWQVEDSRNIVKILL